MPSSTRSNGVMYRGGFSSSICNLFSSKDEKSDCCALVCCGVLLSDKTSFLLYGQRPSWPRRLAINVGIPVIYLLVMILVGPLVVSGDDTSEEAEAQRAGWTRITLWGLILLISGLILRARRERIRVRLDVMKAMYEERYHHDDTQGRASLQTYINTHSRDVRLAHSTCCACYPVDLVYDNTTETPLLQQDQRGDFCTAIWKAVSSMCCVACCGAWCQCLGMCAIGQEYREISTFGDPQKMDYITFEPFDNYFPRIEELRTQSVYSLWAHLGALSQLSRKLLKILGCALAVLLVVALVGINGSFEAANMLVLIATFLQAFGILWLVHWVWHRLDLSLDAVIKYFASGFVLCTSLALVYELVLSFVFGFVLQVIVIVDVGIEISKSGNENPTVDDIKEYVKEMTHDYPWIFIIGIFMNAFVVAAMVEELAKYFSFWMVEHPDMDVSQGAIVTRNGGGALASSNEATYHSVETNEEGQDSATPPRDRESNTQTDIADDVETGTAHRTLQWRSVDSLGVGITIAMVATALGYACCENILYIFVYTPPTVANEVTTLLVRSIFPVHPLAAAIQSIGVCERDLEGRKHVGIGRIILPAWLLHGSFDFILMLFAFLQTLKDVDTGDDDDASTPSGKDETVTMTDMIPLVLVFVVVLVGALYYILMSRAQRKRLVGLELSSRQLQHPEDSTVDALSEGVAMT